MKMIEVKDYQEMSKRVAEYIIEKVRTSKKLNLGLATGGTPVGTYTNLIEDHKQNYTSYQDVTTFNLDEYVGLSGDDSNSYRYYMNDQLFDHIDIHKSNTYIPRGDASDMQKECLDYEKLLTEHGGIDLQILGIGSNGHIGFNEPGTSFDSNTHLVELAPSTREANARYFSSLEEVPTKAVTMGIATIMKSKEILLLISGENKSEALSQLLHGEVNESFPASVLRNHPYVTIIADKAAIAAEKVRN
ncbi:MULTISPECIES: glucosamine-6-phosphate deaminase [Metabacillus]|jgi:glucosamine-6-phosphate deaminase|uniref:Glucosamine-6-phosphate deaminase n=1 Tax=Metabacillus rhizolycopersici TaxID=2875709 RepID=A0ABS7UXF5_9BACI|nr:MULTISPECIES: glucosamine-6-phosphate deaminase [Metabacillus]MBZ5752620.1 glucosamine-6-phosphate deaminase [Metabacillus rhizolycopersici]MCM3655007.1 glucosamine-6-phosphate deaminase [Metabacillus litoralis]